MIFASVPVIEPPADCEDAWQHWDLGPELLVVDNSPVPATWSQRCAIEGWSYVSFAGHNLGVNGAWNLARARYLEYNAGYDRADTADPLMLFSASVIWNCGLGAAWEMLVDDAPLSMLTDMAWHAIALSAEALQVCGTFDENLWPGYYGDNDYGRRMMLAGYHDQSDPSRWLNKVAFAELGLASCIDAKALKAGMVGPIDWPRLQAYMQAKWGGTSGDGDLVTPFGFDVPLGWWSPSYRPGLENP